MQTWMDAISQEVDSDPDDVVGGGLATLIVAAVVAELVIALVVTIAWVAALR